MTETEKAVELHEKFSTIANSWIEGKRCALACVDEILRVYRKGTVNSEYTKGFWGGVKEKLKQI